MSHPKILFVLDIAYFNSLEILEAGPLYSIVKYERHLFALIKYFPFLSLVIAFVGQASIHLAQVPQIPGLDMPLGWRE